VCRDEALQVPLPNLPVHGVHTRRPHPEQDLGQERASRARVKKDWKVLRQSAAVWARLAPREGTMVMLSPRSHGIFITCSQVLMAVLKRLAERVIVHPI
jgi:hypothetical protein